LVAGEPGIGKSTLFLQNGLLLKNIVTLYISGEESEQQIKMRADRLKFPACKFTRWAGKFLPPYRNVYTNYFQEIKKLKPQLVIIDSVQTLQSPYIESSHRKHISNPGMCCRISKIAKKQTHCFLIGHITKEGSIAGPKILEHNGRYSLAI